MASHRSRIDGTDGEGEGDIGLQGMSLDDASSPQPPQSMLPVWGEAPGSSATHPASGQSAGQVSATSGARPDVARQFNVDSSGRAKMSTDSGLTRYHSFEDGESSEGRSGSAQGATPPVASEREASLKLRRSSKQKLRSQKQDPQEGARSRSGKDTNTSDSNSNSAAATPPSPITAKKQEKEREQRKFQRRLSRFHDDIAGPVSERLAAGSSGGPSLLPRRTSVNGQIKKPLASPRMSSSRRSSSTSQSSSRHGSISQKAQHVSFASSEQGQRASIVKDRSPTPRSPSEAIFGEQSTFVLDVRALQRWILSIGCVNFDLDKGPDLEFLYPSLGISREERDNIAFSSFPDTSIFDDGSAIFSWRVREVPLDSSDNEAPYIASPLGASPAKTESGGHKKVLSTLSDESASTGSLSRKTVPSGARRLLGGLERAARGTLSRSSSTDDYEEDGSVKNSKSNVGATKSADGTLTVPARRGSATSSSSAESGIAHTPLVHADPIESRSATPVIVNQILSKAATATLPVRRNSSRSGNYIHGYCFFRQKRDARIRRGYFQKSIVILSHLPYVSFFSELVRRLGPLYFEKGMPVLEAFCHDVQNWETPEPGAKLHLPLLGSVLSVELPYYDLSQTSSMSDSALNGSATKVTANLQRSPKAVGKMDGTTEDKPLLASIPNTPLVEVFSHSIDDLWLLWECIILAEPILVVGSDPTACSEAVWHMLDLIKPIPYAGDFRPFFTIHDYDFRTLVTKNKPNNGIILGVTNPFMLQACKHWPHVLKVGRAASKQGGVGRRVGNSDGSSATVGGVGKSFSGAVGIGVAGGSSAGGGGPEHTLGLLTKRKRRVSKDRVLIKQISDALAGKGASVETVNEVLSKYFADMTERFLAPLNRYVSSLIPADFDLSSPLETPNLKAFSSTAFLASLKQHGTPLLLKSRSLPTGAAVRQSLYSDFIQCPNFSLWLHNRIRQSQEEQYVRKLTALATGNVAAFASSKGEIESMELYTRLQREIKGINDRLIVGRSDRELKPNSRWKPSSSGAVEGADGDGDAQASSGDAKGGAGETEGVVRSSSSSTVTAVKSNTTIATPLSRLASLPASRESGAWIRQTLSEAGWTKSFTRGERTLLIRKAELIEQLQRLVQSLQPDLRVMLEAKEVRPT